MFMLQNVCFSEYTQTADLKIIRISEPSGSCKGEREILIFVSKVNQSIFKTSQTFFKQTPLHISVVKNQTEAVALLLQNGADPNTPDVNGNTTIHLAATDSHLIDCLQLLLHSHKGFKISKLNERNYAGKSPCGDCSFQSHLAYTNEFRLLQ